MKNKKSVSENIKEAQEKILPRIENILDALCEKIKYKKENDTWGMYCSLKKEYERNKIEYNFRSPSITKNDRASKYMALTFQQGALKALESVLGFEVTQEGPIKPNSEKGIE